MRMDKRPSQSRHGTTSTCSTISPAASPKAVPSKVTDVECSEESTSSADFVNHQETAVASGCASLLLLTAVMLLKMMERLEANDVSHRSDGRLSSSAFEAVNIHDNAHAVLGDVSYHVHHHHSGSMESKARVSINRRESTND